MIIINIKTKQMQTITPINTQLTIKSAFTKPQKTTMTTEHKVSNHTRTLTTVTNTLQQFLKTNNMTKSEHDRQLGVLMQTQPIDFIIEDKGWYHLDKQRNKLYHEQYL